MKQTAAKGTSEGLFFRAANSIRITPSLPKNYLNIRHLTSNGKLDLAGSDCWW
jgi:hypothetical protein